MIERSPRLRLLRLTALVCACIPATACTDPAAPVLLAWEGDIASAGPGGPIGSAAMVSQYGRTEASISLEGLPTTTYRWRIHEGTCAATGELVGGAAVYPALTTDEDGTASEETNIAGTLDGETEYAVRVLAGEADTLLACGNLDRLR